VTDRAKILIVDDDRDTLKLLELVLHNAGFDVARAENGKQAIQRLAEGRPVLVLCDILMPEMDGYETLLFIRSTHEKKDLPVVMLSALGQEKDVQRAMAAGANSYITKPFSLRQLLSEVRAFVPISAQS
jgi:two-component system, sensor histidine kinase ChiS